jgi:hypothetical protein
LSLVVAGATVGPPLVVVALTGDAASGLATFRIASGAGMLVGATGVGVIASTSGTAVVFILIGMVLLAGIGLALARRPSPHRERRADPGFRRNDPAIARTPERHADRVGWTGGGRAARTVDETVNRGRQGERGRHGHRSRDRQPEARVGHQHGRRCAHSTRWASACCRWRPGSDQPARLTACNV